MFFLALKNLVGTGKRRGQHLPLSSSFWNDDYNLYDESHFKETLRIEKHRTERSGKPFLLMLLDLGLIRDYAERNEVIGKIAFTLNSCIRNTDIKGWYEYNSVVGVIFTELREVKENFVESRILRKIHKNLSTLLDLDQLSEISISFQTYPEEDNQRILAGLGEYNPGKTDDAFIGINFGEQHLSCTNKNEILECHLEAPKNEAKISIGFTKERWFLFLGDALLIYLSILFSTVVTGGSQSVNVLNHYPGLL
ncbi:MAG: hypothetical protein WCA08_24055, partial [Desulfoferrobacter sp.]